MAKRKANSAQVSNSQAKSESQLSLPPEAFFPFARYTSVVGVHTSLLTFASLFLPQSAKFLSTLEYIPGAVALTSLDRPQHPFLEPITGNPVVTLFFLCTGAAILQGWWGGWVRDWAIEYQLEGTDEEKLAEKLHRNQHKPRAILNAWSFVGLATLAFHIVLVLFGAPITSRLPHTFLLALLFSILTVFTPAYVLGVPLFRGKGESFVIRMAWTRLFAEFSFRNAIERALVYPGIGSFWGSWIGVVPVALDWDRPWQAWPLTPAYGALAGYILGSMAALAENGTRYLAEQDKRHQQQTKMKRN